MSENELLRQWTATGDRQFLSLLMERLYLLGEEKLSDKVSKDVLHNSMLKIHARIEKGDEIREIRSFFLKTLYNGVMDFYKKASSDLPLKEEYCESEELACRPLDLNLDKIRKLELLIRNRELGKSRIKFLYALLIERETEHLSRQNRFFHRSELHKAVSLFNLKNGNDGTSVSMHNLGLLDMDVAGRYFTYELRVLKEVEDDQQRGPVRHLFKQAVDYKRRALSMVKDAQEFNEMEGKLLYLFNMTIALDLFKQATELNPMFFKSRFSIGFCYYKLNRFDDAVKEFDATAFYLNKSAGQSNFDVKMGSTLRNLGTIHLCHLQQYHKALENFQQALRFTPEDEKVRLGLIFSACKLNDMEVALDHAKLLDKTESKQRWTSLDSKMKVIAIDIYKQNEAIREYIPIERII